MLKVNSWFFFFSSRRRHTRLQGDWSSDVCSSDLSLNTTVTFNGTSVLPFSTTLVPVSATFVSCAPASATSKAKNAMTTTGMRFFTLFPPCVLSKCRRQNSLGYVHSSTDVIRLFQRLNLQLGRSEEHTSEL